MTAMRINQCRSFVNNLSRVCDQAAPCFLKENPAALTYEAVAKKSATIMRTKQIALAASTAISSILQNAEMRPVQERIMLLSKLMEGLALYEKRFHTSVDARLCVRMARFFGIYVSKTPQELTRAADQCLSALETLIPLEHKAKKSIGTITVVLKTGKQWVRRVKKLTIATQTVQACMRMHAEQQSLLRSRAAAGIFQAAIRTHRQRLIFKADQMHFLPSSLFQAAVQFIDKGGLAHCKNVTRGRTSVYVPKKLPHIVIKTVGTAVNQRFDKMYMVRKHCIERGYTHLTVPRAHIYHAGESSKSSFDYLIEDRVAIKYFQTKTQIGLYSENPDSFDKVARQFTLLLSERNIGDIIGSDEYYQELPVKMAAKNRGSRYDTCSLYLTGPQGARIGNIGLIDLKSGYLRDGMAAFKNVVTACKTALRFFPLHEAVILAAGKSVIVKEYPSLSTQMTVELDCRLQTVKENALEYHKAIYGRHAQFIREKGISLVDKSILPRFLSPARRAKIVDAMSDLMQSYHNDKTIDFCISAKGCLGEYPDALLERLKEGAFPKLLELTLNVLSQISKRYFQPRKPTTFVGLVAYRTIILPDAFGKMLKTGEDLLKDLSIKDEYEKKLLTERLAHVIFQELAAGGELAAFHPYLASRGGSRTLIFY